MCTNTAGSYRCSCNPGYTQSGHQCNDINECLIIVPSPCRCGVSGEPCGAHCTNLVPHYACSCAIGFRLRSGGTVCDDINECRETPNGGCQQICRNFPGKFSCDCFRGFRKIANNDSRCEDIDECLSSNGFCSHQCINTAGSYYCRCNAGYYLDSNGQTCSDRDECLLSSHGCQHRCNNFHGSFFCSCNTGYALKQDNKTCADVNECNPVYAESLNRTIIPAGCDQLCHNTLGNFTCSCNQGYRLLYDGKRCRDINECSAGTHSCEHICHNTPGSYGCSCLYGYRLKADMRSCEGLPCEVVVTPPNGRMTCSGLVTNESCWFSCNDGYELLGSKKRKCLNSSEWDGQQTFCKVKHCPRLVPPENAQVYLPCFTTFGSTCTLGCMDGYLAFGDNQAICNVTNSGEVEWHIGNFHCEEIKMCKPNPCRHGGKCVIVNARQFSCDCQNTGYKGDLCEKGLVTLPDFPKLLPGNPSQKLVLQAKPDNSLTVTFNSAMNVTIQPQELTIKHPSLKGEFQVTGHECGVGEVSYDLKGTNKDDFVVPENSILFFGRNISGQKSVYTRLGMLVGELPIGTHEKVIKNDQTCDIRMMFDCDSTSSNGIVVENGPVHISTSDNTTVPLSLVGYNFSSPYLSRSEITERLLRHVGGKEELSAHVCSGIQLTAGDIMEFIQRDALPTSFMRYYSEHLPLWLNVKVREDNHLFDVNNTMANLVQATVACTLNPICKFPVLNKSAVVLYQPTMNYNIFLENEHLSLSSKGSCFVIDTCEKGVFLALPQTSISKVRNVKLMQYMADGGWEVLVSSLGFTAPRRYSKTFSTLSDGHLAKNFSDFHYNVWLKGSADISLGNSSNFAVNIKMNGEAFLFVDNLSALLTAYFSQPIMWVFRGSVDFNITLRALGQGFTLTFHENDITGKAKFGGDPVLASNFRDDCEVPQGFVFTIEKSSEIFKTSPLANVIKPSAGFTVLQIYHSITGGQTTFAQDHKNNLRFLEWQAQGVKRILLDVKMSVPEIQSDIKGWESLSDDMLFNAVKARRLLSLGSSWFQLKVLVAKIDDSLNTMTRGIDLIIDQLQPYRNRTNIEGVIDRFIRLKADLPKTISLSFSKSAVHQNLAGFRFLLTSHVCHKRLCFANMKSSIWSLHDDQCGTSPPRQTAGLLVEGTAAQSSSLGNLMKLPTGGTLQMFLTRNKGTVVTTFNGLVNLLGLKENVTITLTGNKLSFSILGPIFGEFDASLSVNADVENIVNWNSIVYTVEGRMNKTSRLHTLLEKKIINETELAAAEAIRRLANAEGAFNNAQKKADVVKDILEWKRVAVEELKVKKDRAADKLRVARLKYHLAKIRFNRTFYFRDKVGNLVCEIQECNYTCLRGCVFPDLCQDAINISYLERHCNLVERPVTVEVVQQKTEKRSFEVPTSITVYTGNCRSGPSLKTILSYAVKGAKLGWKIGSFIKGPVGGVVGAVIGGIGGAVVGVFSKKIFGCSNTYEKVPGEPRRVEYDHKTFDVKAVERIIKEVKCTGHTEKTKPGGFGPPYQCCKRYGCQTKIIDPQCVINNEECLLSMTELKFTLDAMNESLVHEFTSMRSAVDEVKKATFSYEKARVRHEGAVTRLKHIEAHMEQELSAVELTNASMRHVRQIVDFGLKISDAMNASHNENVVDISEMQFSVSMASQRPRKIVIQANAKAFGGQSTPVRFLVDFDKAEHSISAASKTVIATLFGDKRARRRRSIPEDSANSTHILQLSLVDYPYACLFTNKTHLYFSDIMQSLSEVISSVKGLNVKLFSGLHDLERLHQFMNASSSLSNVSWSQSIMNESGRHSNSSFKIEFLEMIQVLKDENIRMANDSSQSWNETLEAWRAFLEIFTVSKGFKECSGTQDCVEYFFEGAKEFYEFEDSPRALEIKEALNRLRQMMVSLGTEDLTMLETERVLNEAATLLNKTRDDSVLCGGPPRITSSSHGELVLFPGDILLLSCTAEKEVGLRYAWKKNDEIIKDSTNGTFYLGGVTKENEGTYVCVVSNNKGNTLSNVTIVKVHTKPKITRHPQSQRVVFRSQMPGTLVCNATGEPTPIFQWFFQSSNSSAVKVNETKPVLYIANPRLDQEGYYYCEASNKHGVAVSQRARLDVLNYTIGLPRLLVAFNLTTRCWLTANSSNSSLRDPELCILETVNASQSWRDRNLTNNLLRSISRSLKVSPDLISHLDHDSFANTSKSSVAFVLDIDNKPWGEENFTFFVEIVEAISEAEDQLIAKVEQLNLDVHNKTFNVSWNKITLFGEPGSVLAYPLSPECPDRQSLTGNGFICANCPAGSYFNTENDTCLECPFGTYQPLQGQKDCISCGKNLTTTSNGTLEESECIADCPSGSYSTRNRTCILCPIGTYQPYTGRITCISCGQDYTTTSNGTVNKTQCLKLEPPTTSIPTTVDGPHMTVEASSPTSQPGVLEIKLFFSGKLPSLDTKSRKAILSLLEEKVSSFLNTIIKKNSEIGVTEQGAEVVVFVNTEDVDKNRVQELLREGIEIEYGGKKMLFVGFMTTTSSPRTFSPDINEDGKTNKQKAEEFPWKLPAFIGGPGVVILLIVIVVIMIYCKRRKIKTSKPSTASATCQFDNPTYGDNENPPAMRENAYSLPGDSRIVTRGRRPEIPPKPKYDEPNFQDKKILSVDGDGSDEIYDDIEMTSGSERIYDPVIIPGEGRSTFTNHVYELDC